MGASRFMGFDIVLVVREKRKRLELSQRKKFRCNKDNPGPQMAIAVSTAMQRAVTTGKPLCTSSHHPLER